uniref:FBA_2 domain-containing protein n=1 Tax=Caenorhabditis tropicalis TaxID=1561998 RepID=A0A1I7TZF7_9PELO
MFQKHRRHSGFGTGPLISVQETVNGDSEIVVRSHKNTTARAFFTCRSIPCAQLNAQPKNIIQIDRRILKFRTLQTANDRRVFLFNEKYQEAITSNLVRFLCEMFNVTLYSIRFPDFKKNLVINQALHLVINNKSTLFGPVGTKANQLDNFLRRIPIPNFGLADIRAFLDTWCSGESTKIHSLTIHTNINIYIDEYRLQQRYSARAFDPTKRVRTYSNQPGYVGICPDLYIQCDCADGYDIERKDGVLATIKLAPNTFRFFVWHNRFPGVVGQRVVTTV